MKEPAAWTMDYIESSEIENDEEFWVRTQDYTCPICGDRFTMKPYQNDKHICNCGTLWTYDGSFRLITKDNSGWHLHGR